MFITWCWLLGLGGEGLAGLSQEHRRVKGKLFFLPNTHKAKYVVWIMMTRGFPGKEPACQCRRHKRLRFNLWIRKIPWRRAWRSTPVLLSGESHGHRSLVATVHGVIKSQTRLKQLMHAHMRARDDETNYVFWNVYFIFFFVSSLYIFPESFGKV